jgi:uncharacterized coiled-coil protein SlyX
MLVFRLFAMISVVGLLVMSAPVLAQSGTAQSLARLQAAAQKQNNSIDDAKKTEIQNTCRTAQANLQLIRQKEPRNYQNYSETYLDVQNEINALEIRLKRQGVTIQGIDQTLMNYKERVDQYDRLNYLYQQALNDVVEIDCKENPVEFVAGINVLRQLRAQILSTTKGIESYIFKEVNDQFIKVKAQLKV